MKLKKQTYNHLKDNSECSFADFGLNEIEISTAIAEAYNKTDKIEQQPIIVEKVQVKIPSLNGEIWKPIPNYKGLYEISNLGRVKSFKNVIPIILKNQRHNRGYRMVTLFSGGKSTPFLIQQLMGIAFFGVKSERAKMIIDHIDGNKTNNQLSNLQVLSHRQNISKGYKSKDTSSNLTGVVKIHNGTFVSRISISGKQRHLGTFKLEVDAAKAYQKALLKNRIQKILQKILQKTGNKLKPNKNGHVGLLKDGKLYGRSAGHLKKVIFEDYISPEKKHRKKLKIKF